MEIPSTIIDVSTSPIKGADGNREYLILLKLGDNVGLTQGDVLKKLLI